MSLRMLRWLALMLGTVLLVTSASFAKDHPGKDQYRQKAEHVLLISLDGLHQFDLERYILTHPNSTLADLASRGVRYTNAIATRPSDSFPGSLAMVTGGSPASTGILYDAMWDDNLSAPGSNCATRGTTVTYKENVDVNVNDINTVIDPAKLPLDPANGCVPVYPHSYLQVNTIFEVIKRHGGRTAYADKHPSYELYNGPSGIGMDDLYTPEINANKANKSLPLTEVNDDLKVAAVLNQIDGLDHTGTTRVGVPTVFGMNFQTVNQAQKLVGYANANGDLSAGMATAYDRVDASLGQMVAELRKVGLLDSTLIIVTAKHANGPVDFAQRAIVVPDVIKAFIEGVQPGLTGTITADTSAIIWLTDHSRTPEVLAVLKANAAAIGAETFLTGADLANGQLNVAPNRRPDIVIVPKLGVIFTTATDTKKMEHGGFHDEDIHVPILLSQPGIEPHAVISPVEIKQIAPTILVALGMGPMELQAVRLESTQTLPGISFDLNDDKDEE